MSQIRDKKTHRKRIATMNPINAKSVQLIELHAFAYYLYPCLNYFTSSKSALSQYEQLAYTCCNYIANPKISIQKQPRLLTAKVRFLFINKEM